MLCLVLHMHLFLCCRYEAVYGPAGYSMSSFRGRDPAGIELGNTKLATDV